MGCRPLRHGRSVIGHDRGGLRAYRCGGGLPPVIFFRMPQWTIYGRAVAERTGVPIEALGTSCVANNGRDAPRWVQARNSASDATTTASAARLWRGLFMTNGPYGTMGWGRGAPASNRARDGSAAASMTPSAAWSVVRMPIRPSATTTRRSPTSRAPSYTYTNALCPGGSDAAYRQSAGSSRSRNTGWVTRFETAPVMPLDSSSIYITLS